MGGEGGAPKNARAESHQGRVRIVAVSVVGGVARGVNRRRIIHGGRIARHVNHPRVGRHDLDDGIGHDHDPLLDCLLHYGVGHDDILLLCGLQRAGLLCLKAQRLDGIHQFLALLQKRLPQCYRPLQVGVHFGDELRELRHGLDAVIP